MDTPREVIGHQFACYLSPHIACLLTDRQADPNAA